MSLTFGGIENTHYDGEGDQALQINQIETAVAQGMEHMETILEEGYLVELVIANNDDMTATVEQDTEGQARAVACIAENMLRGHDRFDGIDEEVKDNWCVSIPYIPYTGY